MTGDLSAVWTSPLAGIWVFGAGYQHEAYGEQNLSVVWTSGHLLWLEYGCLVLDTNMKHVENKTCLLSGHLLWLEYGCLVLDTNMKHVENKTCLWSGHLDISSGWSLGVWCWVPT